MLPTQHSRIGRPDSRQKQRKSSLTEADKDHFARQLRDIAIEDEDGDYLGRIMALRSDAAALYVKPTRNTNID